MDFESERWYWLAWSRIPGIGPLMVQRIAQVYDSLQTAWFAPLNDLAQIEGIGPKLKDAIATGRQKIDLGAIAAELERQQIRFWTAIDPDYPAILREIPSFPPVLYYQGCPELVTQLQAGIGIVGTRNATEYGRRWTQTISEALSQHGFTIVSGLAAGIDAEAHRACLQAGGKTIAVLGTGVDVPYPRQNLKLYEQLCDRGLIVSDYPPGTPPNSQNFPPRNRIIAGLSRAVLVMEGAEKSGAMITARYANEFNRDVYVLPGSLDNPQALGCLALCNQGAQIILGTRSLLEALGEMPQLDQADAPAAASPPPDLAPHLLQVWSAIAPEPTSFDRIAATCGRSSGEVSGALLELELMGLVTRLPGLQYRRS